jgi:hypothetical protein
MMIRAPMLGCDAIGCAPTARGLPPDSHKRADSHGHPSDASRVLAGCMVSEVFT